MQKRKKHTGFIIALSIITLLVITAVGTAGIYSRFGGFGTGECADTKEFAKYATNVSALTVPDEAQIVALGEATHGNKEFQQLRLDVLQILVEKYGVRSFALEGLTFRIYLRFLFVPLFYVQAVPTGLRSMR